MSAKTWTGTTSSDWSVAGNWSPSGVPVTADDVFIDGSVSVANISAGLDQHTVQLASLTVLDTYTGLIGTPTLYLQVGATVANIGQVTNGRTTQAGSLRIKLDLGSADSVVYVYSTATSSNDAGLEPVRVIGSGTNNTLTVLGGTVGIATTSPSETATFHDLNAVGTGATSGSNVSVLNVGRGATLLNVSNNGGNIVTNSAVTTVTNSAGTYTAKGSGVITTLNGNGGFVNLLNRPASGNAITTLNINGANFNTKLAPALMSIGTTNIKRGGNVVVFSQPQISWGTVTFDPTNMLGLNISLEG